VEIVDGLSFVHPEKWAIDLFLEQRIERDTWVIRPSDRVVPLQDS
jgi:hypothetical protein